MEDITFSYEVPEFKELLVSELDSSVIPLFKEYQSATRAHELEALVESNFSSEDISKYREFSEEGDCKTDTWEYEIGFLGYKMGKKGVNDLMLRNVLTIQFYRTREVNKSKKDYPYDPLRLFIKGFGVAFPFEEKEKNYKRCMLSLIYQGIGEKEIMKQLNISFVN
jgi:hypothetical protein